MSVKVHSLHLMQLPPVPTAQLPVSPPQTPIVLPSDDEDAGAGGFAAQQTYTFPPLGGYSSSMELHASQGPSASGNNEQGAVQTHRRPSLAPLGGLSDANSSDINLPSLAEVQADAVADAQARFQQYHQAAAFRAASAGSAVGSGAAHDDDVVDLSHSPSLQKPASFPLPETRTSHHRHLRTDSNASSAASMYASPLSINTSLTSPSHSGSPLHTPKGHPLELQDPSAASSLFESAGQGFLGLVHTVGTAAIDHSATLKGFMGGQGTGVAPGMRSGVAGVNVAETERKWIGSYGQKIYRPTHPRFNSPSKQGQAPSNFRSTLSYLTRIPRRFRPTVFGALAVFFLVSWIVRWNGHADSRTAARRQAMHMQRAFVMTQDMDAATAGLLARHPASHLTATLVRQAQSEYHAATAFKQASYDDESVNPYASAPEFQMSKKEELAALFSFFTSTSSNALPPIDPEAPLDPQLVLDFDYTKPTARDDMAELEREIWGMFPIVLVGKMRDPWHREIKKMLAGYRISPPPMIIEVDQRSDATHLVPLLARLLESDELPQVIVGGRTIGSYKQVKELLENNKLMAALADGGATVSDKKLKRKPKYIKDAERAEAERILGPKPIESN